MKSTFVREPKEHDVLRYLWLILELLLSCSFCPLLITHQECQNTFQTGDYIYQESDTIISLFKK